MRVVLADDHPLVRNGIRTALADREDIEVVAEAGTGDAALEAVLTHRPDLLILDLFMPGLECESVVIRATEAQPELKTMILTAYDDDVYVRRMSRLAIRGYVLKDEATEDLLRAIQGIERGAVWFSHRVAQKMMKLGNNGNGGGASSGLSLREEQILTLLSRGETNHEIASLLHLREQTVRNYVSTIYAKIQVTTRAMAVVWARERGIQ